MVTAAPDPPPFDLTPVSLLTGVGPRQLQRLAILGIRSVQDLLLHLPLRYEDRTQITPIAALHPGISALIEVTVIRSEIRQGRRQSLLVTVQDRSGCAVLRFFHFTSAQNRGLTVGTRLRCYGEVRAGLQSLELIHPEYRTISAADPPAVTAGLTPIYPTTDGLHQLAWRQFTEQALHWLVAQPARLVDWLPEALCHEQRLPSLPEALRLLHRPPCGVDQIALAENRHPAQWRLAFEELIAHQLGLRQRRLQQQRLQAPPLTGDGRLRTQLRAQLPFQLTAAQERVCTEIAIDLAQPQPMLRLLQGDVGSGKTVVAVLATLQAVEAGYQVAFMAPTELLAEQHFHSLRTWLAPLSFEPAWLTSRTKGRERAQILAALATGQTAIAIGTHALFQAEVTFKLLGLVIVDEQHRFGVQQRLTLREKGTTLHQTPHQLMMTATPIPRSLAMTAYADLDLSVIDELPPGRLPVMTVALSDQRRMEVIERVRVACAGGRQAYWICTLIDESDALQCQAAADTTAQLKAYLIPITVGLVHGRLKPAERDTVMADFKAGVIQLLVATTVVEVGLDVPNASLMIIENPERLGLAQLHQLRGRIGRGVQTSHCVLLYRAPLTVIAQARLEVLRRTRNGFEIAQKDLELRGPGEVLGTRQTGVMQLRLADPAHHQMLVAPAQRAADCLLREWPHAATALEARWLGMRKNYGMA